MNYGRFMALAEEITGSDILTIKEILGKDLKKHIKKGFVMSISHRRRKLMALTPTV